MRLPKIRTVLFIVGIIRDNYFLTPTDKALFRRFARRNARLQETKGASILVQAPQDYYFFSMFGEIVTAMRRDRPIRVGQYTVRDLRGGSSLSLKRLFWNLVTTNFLSDWKWQRLYSSFANEVAYRTASWLAPWTEIFLWWRAYHIWRAFEGVNDLAKLTVDGIIIGDLVIDSYIRFKPAPSVALDSWYLLVTIRQALKNLRFAQRYLVSARPRLLLTSYTTYISHGIPARVAAALGIRVLSFGNLQELSKDITALDPCHTKNGSRYKQDFLAFEDQKAKYNVAEDALSARIRGVIDKATGYMKVSGYSSEKELTLDVRGMPVIFLHDFYDSAHIYRWILFHDFWSWVCFTVDTFRNAGISFIVKPHPNQVTDSNDVIDRLREKYPDIQLIPTGISNKQLVQSGIACAVTVYGTVASEMAYMGVPTVSCGDNPHVSFDFCRTAKSQAEYAELLEGCREITFDPEAMRLESCAFYYMHALNYSEQSVILSDKASDLRSKLFYAAPPPADEIMEALDRFGRGPEFQDYCDRLVAQASNGADRTSNPR